MNELPWAPRTWSSEDRKAEFHRWLDACIASMCALNWRPKEWAGIEGIEMRAECDHLWCHGVVDVINRRLFERY